MARFGANLEGAGGRGGGGERVSRLPALVKCLFRSLSSGSQVNKCTLPLLRNWSSVLSQAAQLLPQ